MLAAATRQNGILIFLPFLILSIVSFRKEKWATQAMRLLIPALFIILSIAVAFLWPRFGTNKRFLEPENLAGRLQILLYAPQYFLIFLSPVFIGIKGQLKGIWRKSLAVIITASAALYLFRTDLFPMGNMLYIEELYAKSDFRSNFSLFDNIFAKLFFAIIWGLGFTKVLFYIIIKFKNRLQLNSLRRQELFLLISFALNKICVYLAITLLAVISIVLQWDFSARNTLMWKQLEELRQKTGMSTQIDFNDTYINHIAVRESGDFTGLESRRGSFDPLCFIQDYTLDSSSEFSKKVESLGRVISSKTLENPKPIGVRKKTLPRIKNNLDNLLFNEEYSTLLYGLVGKKTYVGSFCVNDSD
ncbi:MAG: hypothetical protein UV49_C0031G0026 [candidate division WWE3 bacterium GW2011_GWA2_42_9]|nr:MAG: hypothetical protein UV49_C0031G0026 [candidate division WWE3 bacterium GW2011_GWA2_42_9]